MSVPSLFDAAIDEFTDMYKLPWLLILMMVCLAPRTQAQELVQLRAAHRGEFLPEETDLIILSREARIEKDGRYQPEFFPVEDYPIRHFDGARRDRLAAGGRSARRHARTESSGRLYFLYALTPDSTLYWSYSAERDSLKFDVVRTGVMSVAPVYVSDVRSRILEALFSASVTVHMPSRPDDERGSGMEADAGRVRASGASERTAAGDSSSAANRGSTASASREREGGSTALRSNPTADAPQVRDAGRSDSRVGPGGSGSDAADMPPFATAARLDAENDVPFGLSPVLILALLLISAAAGAAYSARRHRRDVKRLRGEMEALKDRLRSMDRYDR